MYVRWGQYFFQKFFLFLSLYPLAVLRQMFPVRLFSLFNPLQDHKHIQKTFPFFKVKKNKKKTVVGIQHVNRTSALYHKHKHGGTLGNTGECSSAWRPASARDFLFGLIQILCANANEKSDANLKRGSNVSRQRAKQYPWRLHGVQLTPTNNSHQLGPWKWAYQGYCQRGES